MAGVQRSIRLQKFIPKEVLNYENDIIINEKNIKIVPVASQNHSKEATNDILAVGTLKDIHIDHNDDEMGLSVLLKKYFVEEKSIVLKIAQCSRNQMRVNAAKQIQIL